MKKTLEIGRVFLIFISLTYSIYKIYPYEILYFNNLMGGLEGGKNNFLYAFDYWQTSLRELINWVNKNAPTNSKITLVNFYDYNVMEPALLRKDIQKIKLAPNKEPINLQIENNSSKRVMMEK